MNNLKRFTVCTLANHKWATIACPPSPACESRGTFLRCLRCGKENHDAGSIARGGGSVFQAPATGSSLGSARHSMPAAASSSWSRSWAALSTALCRHSAAR